MKTHPSNRKRPLLKVKLPSGGAFYRCINLKITQKYGQKFYVLTKQYIN